MQRSIKRSRKGQALSPKAAAIRRDRRLNALARGRDTTAARKRERSRVRSDELLRVATLLSIGGASLNEMATILAKVIRRSPGTTRKLLYKSRIVPEHLQQIMIAARGLYFGDREQVDRAISSLSVENGRVVSSLWNQFKNLPELERKRKVLATCFGFPE